MKSILLPAGLVFVLLLGCDSGPKAPKRAGVSGVVNYNGKPVETGKITFSTDGRPPLSLDIVNGKFSGLAMVGLNKIQISAMKKGSGEKKLPMGAQAQIKGYMAKEKGSFGGFPADFDPDAVDYIPPEWGVASQNTREVADGADNQYIFEIKGK
jgi:hypothetical protein